MTRHLIPLFLFLAALFSVRVAEAHGTRVVSVDVTEISPGKAVVHTRATFADDAAQVRPLFAAPCALTPASEGGDAVALVTCPGTLAGNQITVEGLTPIVSEAILIVSLYDGQRLSRVLTAEQPSFALPAAQSGLGVARSYVKLGIAHILTGYDHLLFLVSLVLLLRRPRAVLLAETAFTVSHSLSFSATSLGLIHVSATAAEAAIALSLVLCALDIGKSETPSSARMGAAMAFVFGLVHGLGFAGGLSEIGLPDAHVSLALLGFAGGVEIGQVAFLALAMLAFYFATRRLAAARLAQVLNWSSIAVGGVASYWLIERTVVCLTSRV